MKVSLRLSEIVPMLPCGGRMVARWTMEGVPSLSRKERRASPVLRLVSAASVSKAGFCRKVWAAARTTFCSAGVKARRACCTRAESWLRTVEGTSIGFWVMKKTPTPLDRIRRTVCSIRSIRALGQSLNSRWASSKKNTIRGSSLSPVSGRSSYSSPSIHSRKVEYRAGLLNSLSAARMLTTPIPFSSWVNQSARSSAGSPKKTSPPWSSRMAMARWMAPTEAFVMFP